MGSILHQPCPAPALLERPCLLDSGRSNQAWRQPVTGTEPEVGLRAFQDRIEALYLARDRQRGIDGTFTWFVEEVGELAKELRRRPRDPQRLQEEMGDVLAWLVTLASLLEVDIEAAARRYDGGCPKCGGLPCAC
ncbi:MAG: nucleotide pyrophosphohydrolase [Caldilineae bacterium]|nr:nucleotide pyrophosphohydrolase [Chloroflexota bacterium]MCB9177704.1 nucleotide pyrophosphohydrolase [Caldilineae bacterium]